MTCECHVYVYIYLQPLIANTYNIKDLQVRLSLTLTGVSLCESPGQAQPIVGEQKLFQNMK